MRQHIVSNKNARHYHWKTVCDGWHLVDREDLSVITERMPPHTAEDMHYHETSRQFFYILSGQAVMQFADGEETLRAGEGIEVAPDDAHQMTNNSDSDIEFLVVSMPKSHGDRIIVPEIG